MTRYLKITMLRTDLLSASGEKKKERKRKSKES